MHATHDLLSNLTGEQALDVLQRLAGGKGAIAEAILTEAKCVLTAVDVEDVADEVFMQLDGIVVEDCWDRAGRHQGGYTSPEEAAMDEFIRQHCPDWAKHMLRGTGKASRG